MKIIKHKVSTRIVVATIFDVMKIKTLHTHLIKTFHRIYLFTTFHTIQFAKQIWNARVKYVNIEYVTLAMALVNMTKEF